VFPFPNPNPAGWSGIQPVTAEQITQINANAAAAADGSRWSDYAHLMNWHYGSWNSIDIFANGAEQFVPSTLRTQTFIHWVPGPDCWLRSSDYLGQHLLTMSRDKGLRFRTLPVPALDRAPWLVASKESTGEVAVMCQSTGGTDTYKFLSFTITPPFLRDGLFADEIGVDYATIDSGFAPGSMTGFSPRDLLWVPERQWWMFGFVGVSGGIRTSPDLATWTSRTLPGTDTTHGVYKIVGNGEGVYIAGNHATDATYWRSEDGGETWAEHTMPDPKGATATFTYVPDLGLWVYFLNASVPGNIYTSPTGEQDDWTPASPLLSVKDVAAAGRVLVAIMDPSGANTDQQLVCSVDGAATFFRLGCDIEAINTVRFNGKQAAVQRGGYPINGTDSPFICSQCSG
jgi:hypothetical protein